MRHEVKSATEENLRVHDKILWKRSTRLWPPEIPSSGLE